MKILKMITCFSWFTLPTRLFHMSAYNLQALPSKLNVLDDNRRQLQKEIVALCRETDVCLQCQGLCCRGNYNHFTTIDYWIRRFSDKPIDEYGDLPRIEPIASLFWNRIVAFMSLAPDFNVTDTKCPNLLPSGCALQPEDRPIRCVIWTCRTFKNVLSTSALRRLKTLTRKLVAISSEVAETFNKVQPGRKSPC
jgi:hypothetical protein